MIVIFSINLIFFYFSIFKYFPYLRKTTMTLKEIFIYIINNMVKRVIRNYTLKSGRTVKEMVVKPEHENGVFTYKDIMNYVNSQIKNVAPHKRVVVRALNILGDRTLDTFNTTLKNRGDVAMMDDGQYDEYVKGKVKDPTKFTQFFNFSISISEDPYDNQQNMFI